MFINTPYGKAEVPNCYVNEYKNKTDIELLEILINQNKRFLDPVLVQICVDKNLLRKGEAKEDLEMKLDDLKIQAYSELKAENERLATLNNQYATQLEQNYNKKPDLQNLCNNLQQQLKEKDEERLEIWKDYKYFKNKCLLLEEQLQANTKQVCEKIRVKIDVIDSIELGPYTKIYKLLDQIEKG